jgi:hypothetical protein
VSENNEEEFAFIDGVKASFDPAEELFCLFLGVALL